MFDLVTGHTERPFRDSKPSTRVLSVVVHTVLLAAILLVPLLYATEQLPKVNQIVAFVVPAATPAPPPPPPPPPAPKARPAEPQPEPRPAQAATLMAAPLEAPSAVLPETVVPSAAAAVEGMVGGVEGGVAGGVAGGIVGGLMGAPPPPPPPKPAPAPSGPVRVGGQIQAPALVTRVDPAYPPVAVAAKLTGTVILELTVDKDGRVIDVNVLRSLGLLDHAAVDAVKKWRYSPLTLNGIATPFIVTVTVNFSLRSPTMQDVG